jgi:hypothetical protein
MDREGNCPGPLEETFGKSAICVASGGWQVRLQSEELSRQMD